MLVRLTLEIRVDESLLHELSNYVLALKHTQQETTISEVVTSQSKKRKLDDTAVANSSAAGWADQSIRADYTAPDISFSIPQRKKLRLEWIDSASSDLAKGGIRAADASGSVEFGVSWKDIGRWPKPVYFQCGILTR
jgi:hypothetical protein